MKTLKFIHQNLRFLLSTSLILLSSLFVNAQENLHQNVEIVNDTATVKFQVLVNDPKIATQPNVIYSWYFDRAINSTAGEYSGMLLDGEYKEYDKTQHLRIAGKYKNGEKAGIWKRWSAKGELTEFSPLKKEQKIQNIVAEEREGGNQNPDNETASSAKPERKTTKQANVSGDGESNIMKMSWNEKKRRMINKWKFERAQRKTAKESGDQIRRKNRREERNIATPVGVK